MNQEDNKDSRAKKGKCQEILSFLFLGLGLAFLIWGIIQLDDGVLSDSTEMVVMVGSFGSCIISILLGRRSLPYILESALEKTNRYYDDKELTELSLLKKEKLEEKLLIQKFKLTESGYYIRTRFAFWKEKRIRYYVRVIEDVDAINALQREAERFDRMNKKRGNFCLLLFVYLDRVNEYDKESIKNIGKNSAMTEDMQQVVLQSSACSVIIVAVDEHTGTGYYLDVDKGITLYAYGCRMLKKIAGI